MSVESSTNPLRMSHWKMIICVDAHVTLLWNASAVDLSFSTRGMAEEFIEIKSGLADDAQVVIGPYSAVARELEQGAQIYIVTEEEYYEGDNNW